jgi:S-adenosylmethionine hydrolase
VGPNNGLLYPAASGEGIKSIWRLHESAFGTNVSNTFHGRDVFIKAAVYLAQGKTPTDFGSMQIDERTLETKSFLDGEIIHIDAYGNYKIHWPHQLTMGKRLVVETKHNKRFMIPVVKTFDDVAPYEPLALLGSHATLEIAINLANAQEELQFALGERLTIQQVE